MKRIVRSDFLISVMAGVVAAAIVAATGASAGATYLITFGCVAIVIGVRLGPERLQHWRETHGASSSHRRAAR